MRAAPTLQNTGTNMDLAVPPMSRSSGARTAILAQQDVSDENSALLLAFQTHLTCWVVCLWNAVPNHEDASTPGTFAALANTDGVSPDQACCACGKPDDEVAPRAAPTLPAGWETKNWGLMNLKDDRVFLI